MNENSCTCPNSGNCPRNVITIDRASLINLNRDHPELAGERLEARRIQLESEISLILKKALTHRHKPSLINCLWQKIIRCFQPANVKPVATGNEL